MLSLSSPSSGLWFMQAHKINIHKWSTLYNKASVIYEYQSMCTDISTICRKINP